MNAPVSPKHQIPERFPQLRIAIPIFVLVVADRALEVAEVDTSLRVRLVVMPIPDHAERQFGLGCVRHANHEPGEPILAEIRNIANVVILHSLIPLSARNSRTLVFLASPWGFPS